MPSSDPDSGPPNSPEDPKSELDLTGKRPEHLSFIQRLRTHFGTDVDPEISLQAPDDDLSGDGEQDSASRTPSSSRELVERLGNQILLGPRYEVRDEIARGGMGTVLRIWDDDLRRNLAMKVMHERGRSSGFDESEADQERLGRFLEEAQITSQLDHPGIVPVHDLGIDDDGRCYFTMRLVRGAELKEVLELAREGREGMTRTKVLGVILKVCEAMGYAHSKGVVHRDLKPSNIMVGRFGETYVMDWGLARVIGRRDTHDLRLKPSPEEITALSLVKTVRRDESEANPDSPLVTMDGDVVGTPCYMAPEQAQGRLEEVGPKSDVYSLGAILYFMLSGQVPYVAEGERVSPHTVLTRVLQGPPTPLSKLTKDQPEELVAICEKAMMRDPEQRYGSMLEVAEDIEAFLENRVVKAYEVGSVAEFRKWVQRNRGMAAMLACMLLLTVIGVVAFLQYQRDQLVKLNDQKTAADNQKEIALVQQKLAESNADRAEEQAKVADEQRRIANQKKLDAQRSEYVANLLAADYSLRLNDVKEARSRLEACDAELRGWEWSYLSLKSDAAIHHSKRFMGGVQELAFDESTGRLVLLLPSSEVKFLDPVQEKVLRRPRINLSLSGISFLSKTDMSVSVQQRRLALVSRDPVIRIHDLDTGEKLFELASEGEASEDDPRATTVAFSPDGEKVASGHEDGGIILWGGLGRAGGQAGDPAALYQLARHSARITGLSWSPDGSMLASAAADGTVFVWDAEIGMALHALGEHSGMSVNALQWSGDGMTIFTAGDDATIGIWDAERGRRQRTYSGHSGPVRVLAYDPKHGRLASGSDDGTVRVWSEDGSSAVLRSHLGSVRALIFDGDGDSILSCDVQGKLLEMDPSGDLSRTDLEPVHGSHDIEAVAFSPDGSRFLTAANDHDLVLWDSASGEPLRRLRGHTNLVKDAVFSQDGRYVLSGSHDETARLWDVQSGRALRVYRGEGKYVKCVAISRDGTRVITCAGDRKVRIFDLESSELLHTLAPVERTQLNHMVVSPDGRHFATDDSIWDLENLAAGTPRAVLRGAVKGVRSNAFSPDGKRFVIGRGTGVFEIWNVEALSSSSDHEVQALLVRSTKDHASWVSSVSFTPDGERIATASADATIRIRSADSGETLLILEEPSKHVEDISISPDGLRILAAGQKGVLRIWEGGSADYRRERRRARLDYLHRLEQAQPLVDNLFWEYFLQDEVMLRIPDETGVAPEVRGTALRLALMRGDDLQLLNDASFEEALSAENEASYPRALRRSVATLELAGGEPDPRTELALGVSRYRNGQYERALADLLTVRQLNRSARTLSPRELGWHYLFLTMTYEQLGQQEQADRSYEDFGEWLSRQRASLIDTLQPLLGELEGLRASAG